MKKLLTVILIALVLALSAVPITVCAAMNTIVIAFSTEGPDTYADGSQVLDGECYALVWTPDEETFQGFRPDGGLIGNSKLVVKVPYAENGHCPNVQFQIDEGTAHKEYPGGTWGVYLLDTRVDTDGKKTVAGIGGAVRGCVKIIDTTPYPELAGATGGIVQNIPAGIQPPTIRDFKVMNGMVYLFLQNTVPAVTYGVAAGQAPGSLSPAPQQAALGGSATETIVVTPASGASGFYRGIVRTAYSEGNVWIILSIAIAFVVSVAVILLVKNKKRPALADSADCDGEEKSES